MQDKSLRFLFIVQGEGRGHMTQAITLFEMLEKAGHKIVAVIIGSSKRREIPGFVRQRITCPIERIQSPNFVTDQNNKSVRIFPTIIHNLKNTVTYLKSLKLIHQEVKTHQPDRIINFYDLLGGIYALLYSRSIPFIGIGHQYLADHPSFEFAPGKPLDKYLFKINNKLTSFRAVKKLALSFSHYQPDRYKDLVVTPPLLRQEVFELESEQGDYLLGYMVNDGYSQEIMQWHQKHQDVKIHCFWDKKDMPRHYHFHKNLVFHQLDDKKFLEFMRNCKGLISTAGFESVCEAMYLGKPVLMIPVQGQYEQACNAIDAKKAQAGIDDQYFNITRFLEYIPRHESQNGNADFRAWLTKYNKTILQELETI
ncbi:MAG: glycosyltransferase family protein [Candidatus Cyclobacteriaceae bacterium M3_2C_046]